MHQDGKLLEQQAQITLKRTRGRRRASAHDERQRLLHESLGRDRFGRCGFPPLLCGASAARCPSLPLRCASASAAAAALPVRQLCGPCRDVQVLLQPGSELLVGDCAPGWVAQDQGVQRIRWPEAELAVPVGADGHALVRDADALSDGVEARALRRGQLRREDDLRGSEGREGGTRRLTRKRRSEGWRFAMVSQP